MASELFTRHEADALLAGLSEPQLRAVICEQGPVVVIAGAGSGKTRVLSRRIARRCLNEETDPRRVMAVTFTRKAAGELQRRLATVGLRDPVAAGTFHSFALMQLRSRWADRGIEPPPLLQNRFRFLSGVVKRVGKGGEKRADLSAVSSEIDWARARLVDASFYPQAAVEAGRTPPVPVNQMAAILDDYQNQKRKRRVVDFDDLLMLATRDMRNDSRYADAVRWRYRHFYVDEFQDVNPLQYELLSTWRANRDDLFVVGDPNQAIYGWNGADPNLLARFMAREPKATVIELRNNYRSSPQILSLAGALTSSPPMTTECSDGPAPTITAHGDDRAEAEAIARRAAEAYSIAGSWSDQAVLVRTNAQLVIIEQALSGLGIPNRIRGGSGPLATPEIKAELKALDRQGINVSVALDDLLDRSLPSQGSVPPSEVERKANLAAFAQLVGDYLATDSEPTGPRLVAWIGTLVNEDLDAKADAVELATFHAAKGLEWPVVHLAGLEEGFSPIAYAKTGAQLAEEKRLLYVAVTRAEAELHLTWAMKRTFGDRQVKRQPSPYLGALQDVIGRLGVAPRHRVDWRSGLARTRHNYQQAIRRAPKPNTERPIDDDAVYQSLRQWRRARARAADVPDHVILPDQALRAVAKHRPQSIGALGALPGITPVRLARFGNDILQLTAPKS